jgi:hypothetical protein
MVSILIDCVIALTTFSLTSPLSANSENWVTGPDCCAGGGGGEEVEASSIVNCSAAAVFLRIRVVWNVLDAVGDILAS